MPREYGDTFLSDGSKAQLGDVYNTSKNYYSLRQRRSGETLQEDSWNQQLITAASEGQALRVEYLLRAGADIDYCDENGLTALHHTAIYGYGNTASVLLTAGADVNVFSGKFGTPMYLATTFQRSEVITALTATKGKLRNMMGSYGTAYAVADALKDEDLCRESLTLKERLSINAPPDDCYSDPLSASPNSVYHDAFSDQGYEHTALSGNLPDADHDVFTNFRSDTRVEYESEESRRAESKSIREEALAGLQRAVTNPLPGAEKSGGKAEQEANPVTPPAADSGESGTEQPRRNHNLRRALGMSKADLISLFHENPKPTLSQVEHPLHYAIQKGYLESFKRLLEAGVPIDDVDRHGQTVLHKATLMASPYLVKSLIEYGADVSRTDYSKSTPLHTALTFPDWGVLELLLRAGAEVNARDRYGRTALGKALHLSMIDEDHKREILRLLRKGGGRE